MPSRPNIILICTDQWRGDCLSIEGHPTVRAPALDDLASRGARFRRAYSATPSCVPARVALMTGLSQESHRRVGYQDGITFEFSTTLPGEFTKAGYQTKAIGKMHVHPSRARIGFEDVLLHDGYLHYSHLNCRPAVEYDDPRCSTGLESIFPTVWKAAASSNWPGEVGRNPGDRTYTVSTPGLDNLYNG